MGSSSERPWLHSCRLLEPSRSGIPEVQGFEAAVAPEGIRGPEVRPFQGDFDPGFHHPDRHDRHEALHGDQKEDRYDVSYLAHERKGKQIV